MSITDMNHIKGYDIGDPIETGGFGEVYKAFQATVGREVAIKVIRPELANKPDFIRRFESEAQLVARLEHPHITPLYDFWRDPKGAYLVMRWLRGGSLRDSLKNGPFELPAAALLLDQVAGALSLAHRNGVIHRDVKPGNILLDEDGNAYLTDFGIAKDLTVPTDHTAPDAITGSLDYISPEQARSQPVTARTDVYSLGVTLFELITGEHPFKDVSSVERLYRHINDPLPLIETLDPRVHTAVNQVIQKATAKDPDKRYADALALAADFREAIGMSRSSTTVEELLTQREHQILQLIIEGLQNKEIAHKLTITLGTVKWHVNQIYSKLGVRSRVQAIIRARELDLIVKPGEQPAPVRIPTEDFNPYNPYKGLRAFQAADAGDFFGRDAITTRLIQRLGETGDFSRFLAVVGPSGSGKSSLVKAGLIPALWRGDLPGSDSWFVVEMMPGPRPLDELQVALERVAANQAGNIFDHLRRDEYGLTRAASLILPDDDSQLVLVVDQFEEVFTLVEDDDARQHFLDLIHAAVTEIRSRVRVVITLRADFYDRPLHYPRFGELVRSRLETIMPLSAEELEEAIRKPAEGVGATFEAGLIATIIGDVNYQPGALPLLQYALTELFESRQGRLLTREAYEALGGTVGALAKKAEEVFQSMSEPTQAITRQIFLRLVTLGEGTEDTRRRVERAELQAVDADSDLVDEIIDTFAAYRLFSMDVDPGTRTPTVEVAHEALLREWERLRAWLNESREDIKMQRTVSGMAYEWLDAARDEAFLARGARLDQVDAWERATGLVLTPLEHEYIQASLDDRKRRETIERERAEREAAQEKRSQNLLWMLVAVLAIATLLSGGLAFLAVDRSNTAVAAQEGLETEQANTLFALDLARRSGLAFAANSALGLNDLDLSVALVNESIGDGTDILLESLRVAEQLVHIGGPRLIVDTGTPCQFIGSFDMRYYIASDCANSIAILELESGETVFETAFDAAPTAFNFSMGSKYFLTSVDNNTFTLWDVSSWEVINETTIDWNGVSDFQFVGDTNRVAFIDVPNERQGAFKAGFYASGNSVAIYDMATGLLERRIEFADEYLSNIGFSQDGSLGVVSGFVANSGDGRQQYRLIVFDAESGTVRNTIDLPHNQVPTRSFAATMLAFSPNNNLLYLSGEPNYIIDWQTSETIRSFAIASVSGTQYPDRTFTYVTYFDNNTQEAVVHSLATGEETRFPNFSVISRTNIPDHIMIKYHGRANEYVLWDLNGRDTQSAVINYSNAVTAVDFNPEGSQFVVVNNEWIDGTGTTIIYDSDSLDEIMRLDSEINLASDVAWSPDGSMIATTTRGHGVILWDARTGEQRFALTDIPSESVYFVDFTHDSRYVLSSHGTFIPFQTSDEIASLYMWDTQNGELIQRIELPVDTVPHWGLHMIEASPVENIVYVTVNTLFVNGGIGADYSTFKVNLDTLEIVEIDFGLNLLWSDFTPDGAYWVAATMADNDIIVVDVQTNEIVRRWQNLENDIWGVSMSSDGTMLATGSGIQSVETVVSLWDFETGKLIRRYLGHAEQAFMLDVTFSPTNKQIISTANDRTLRVLNTDNQSTLDWLFENRFVRTFTCAERELYRIDPLCEM